MSCVFSFAPFFFRSLEVLLYTEPFSAASAACFSFLVCYRVFFPFPCIFYMFCRVLPCVLQTDSDPEIPCCSLYTFFDPFNLVIE